MSTIKINITMIKSLPLDELTAYSELRVVNMDHNPFFPTPRPTVAEVQEHIRTYTGSVATYSAVRSVVNKQARDQARERLMAQHFDWIRMIETTPNLTAGMVATTGYSPYAARTGAELPPPAAKPTWRASVNASEIILTTTPYSQGSKKVAYIWKISADKGQTWQTLPYGGGSHRRKVSSLSNFQEYWFKVTYATTAGEGQESAHTTVVLTPDTKQHRLGAGRKEAALEAAA